MVEADSRAKLEDLNLPPFFTMRFLRTPEQLAFRQEARSWIEANLPREWRHNGKINRPASVAEVGIHLCWERKLFAHGWSGLHWPVRHGGRGLSVMEHLIFQEELGISGAPEGVNGIGRELVGPILMSLGTPEQQDRYLRRILSAEDVWCQGFSEPDAGSDLSALRTRAKRMDQGWRIDGQKVWTSHAQVAKYCLLLARVDIDAAERGPIAMFLVPMDAQGMDVRPIEQINGKDDFCEVFFDGVEISTDALVGTVEEGWRAANEVLSVERGINKLYRQASFLGELLTIHHLCESYEPQLQVRGQIHAFRHRISELYGDLQMMRYRNFALVSRLLRGERLGSDTSAHKLNWSELHQRITQVGLDLLCALNGQFSGTGPVSERLLYAYLASRAETIFAGTSQVQRDIVSQRVLELPRR